MRKILVLAFLMIGACKKKDDNPTYRNFYGKWFYSQTVHKEYTVKNGDTSFIRIDTTHYGHHSDYIDFTQNDVAIRFNAGTQQTDSLAFDEVTPTHFKLDSLLCQVETIEDSVFRFNSIDFGYTETQLVLVTQVFYSMHK